MTSKLWKCGLLFLALFAFENQVHAQDSLTDKQQSPKDSTTLDSAMVKNAKKCQSHGGIWVHNTCQLDIDDLGKNPNENHGIGFGFSDTGGYLFYDYNVLHGPEWLTTWLHQVHFGIMEGTSVKSLLLITQQSLRYIGLRHKTPAGWYAELSLGLARATLQQSSFLENNSFSASGKGSIVGLGGGWQGDDFYYFHIGTAVTQKIGWSDDYNEERISTEYGERDAANSAWSEATKFSSYLTLGFGWYLDS